MNLCYSNPFYEIINQLHRKTSRAFFVGMLILDIVLFGRMNSSICTMVVYMDNQATASMLALRQKLPGRHEATTTSFAWFKRKSRPYAV